LRDELSDGLWLVQNKPSSRSITSLFWKVGDLKKLSDVTTHAVLISLENELSDYLLKLTDENSEEFIEAKKISGGYLINPISYTNISASDLCGFFLRKLAIKIEEQKPQKIKLL
jgi:hypothetical protein